MISALPKSFQHTVQFYESDTILIPSIAHYFMTGLTFNETCIIIATPEHRKALRSSLGQLGLDIDLAEMCGQYIALDAADTLSHFMKDGMPHKESFLQVVGSLVPHLSARPVRAFGEMVAILWDAGNKEGALALEEFWNDLGKLRNFELLCAYEKNSVANDIKRICDTHTLSVPGIMSFA